MPTQSLPTISFDREALGIVEKAQWTDAEDLGQLGAALGALYVTDVAQDLPEGDNSGVGALRARLEDFRTSISWAVLETSDACAELGSGLSDFSANMDSTETHNTQKAHEAAARLGLEEGDL